MPIILTFDIEGIDSGGRDLIGWCSVMRAVRSRNRDVG